MYEIIFTDILTKQTFQYTGENFECYNLQNYSTDFQNWCEGRILMQEITEIDHQAKI